MKPATPPKYPFYTKVVNRRSFREVTIESVIAYITPRHKVRFDLFTGMEHAAVDQAWGKMEIEPPQWQPTSKYKWYEEPATKKEFLAGMKKFNQRVQEALKGEDYREDEVVYSQVVKKAYAI